MCLSGLPAEEKGKSPELTFVQLSDLHCARVQKNPPRRFPMDPHVKDLRGSFDWLRAAVNDVNENVQPDFVVITGDVVDKGADLKSLRKAREILDRLDCPYFPVLGDHDSPEAFEKVFDRELNYSFVFSGWEFVALGCRSGKVSNEGLELLDEVADRAPDSRVVLLLHRPLWVNASLEWLARKLYAEHLQLKHKNSESVLERVAGADSIRAVIAGHIHTDSRVRKNGVTQFTSGSLIESPHTYRVYRVIEDGLESDLRTVSLD
ncbi:MAG: metallophosphoesterase family protein [Planctomycetota bacterium]